MEILIAGLRRAIRTDQTHPFPRPLLNPGDETLRSLRSGNGKRKPPNGGFRFFAWGQGVVFLTL
ncbi:MAG TPA: hypothetical protein PLQ95_04115 [Thiobacillus sp.]|nr:hypothetical protein [Thiobacillus sp.]